MRRRRVSRRALLRASGRAGVGAAGLALVGCGGDDDDDDEQVVAQVQQQQEEPQPAAQQAQQQQQTQQQQQAQQAAQQQGQQQQVQQAEQQAQQEAQQAAPADDDEQQQAVQQAAPSRQYGGNYSVNVTPGWDHIDPHRASFGIPFITFSDSLGRLIQIDDNRGPILAPDIASLPETPDDETYIFRFDQGARFWDRYPTEGGRAFTAEDAAVNINRQIAAVDANGEPDALFARASFYQQTSSVDVTDEMTLALKTDGPNATYLETVHMGYSFMTSPEAIELWDLTWRDEHSNVEYISGTGPFIPTELDENLRVHLERNADYWKSLEGQQMPFFDSISWHVFAEPVALETAYRTGEIDHTTWAVLNHAQIDGIHADFPDHNRYDRGAVLPFGMRFNYNTELADNPWLDRRVPYAFHLAMDRDAIIDFLFLGKGKPSAIQRLNWYHAWAIPDDEMRQLPGYKPVKDEDIAEARALLAAAGIESGSEFPINNPAEFEGAYPGSSELYANMFSQALDLDVKIVLEPYGAMYQQMVDGSFIGHMPVWLSSGTGDPTGGWSNELVFGASGNLERYNFPPVEEIVKRMTVTLDAEARREMAREVSWILLGEDERYGLDGFAPTSVMGNGIESAIYRPYLNLPERAKNTWGNDGYHWHKEIWIDQSHPDVPARSRPA